MNYPTTSDGLVKNPVFTGKKSELFFTTSAFFYWDSTKMFRASHISALICLYLSLLLRNFFGFHFRRLLSIKTDVLFIICSRVPKLSDF